MNEIKIDPKQVLSDLIDAIDAEGAFYGLENGGRDGPIVRACEAIDKPIPRNLARWIRDCNIDDSDWDDGSYEDPPLYRDGELAAMDEARLQKEWRVQCGIHDRGVDNLPMGHPTIENATARLRWVEAEQTRRGFAMGPGDEDA